MITSTIGRFAASRRSDEECLEAARLMGSPGLLRSASVKRSALDQLPDLRRYIQPLPSLMYRRWSRGDPTDKRSVLRYGHIMRTLI
jgi:hypothetical protein